MWEEIAEELDDMFLGDAEVRRRSVKPEAGPRGGDAPVITGEGNFLLDVQFYDGLKLFGEDAEYGKIAEEIGAVAGVVAHGLVVGKAAAAVVATDEGPIVVKRQEEQELAAS